MPPSCEDFVAGTLKNAASHFRLEPLFAVKAAGNFESHESA
jgi:hypothetical protein